MCIYTNIKKKEATLACVYLIIQPLFTSLIIVQSFTFLCWTAFQSIHPNFHLFIIHHLLSPRLQIARPSAASSKFGGAAGGACAGGALARALPAWYCLVH